MPFDEKLLVRIRESLQHLSKVEEKKMFRGVTFMVNGKMCVCVSDNDMLCRFDPELQEEVAEKPGFRAMKMGGRNYRGYCYVSEEGIRSRANFDYWIALALDFNKRAKAAKKRKATKKGVRRK